MFDTTIFTLAGLACSLNLRWSCWGAVLTSCAQVFFICCGCVPLLGTLQVVSLSIPLHSFLCLPLSLLLHCSLGNGLCKATRSCHVAELFEFPVLYCCEEVIMRANVVDHTVHHSVCDMVLVWDAKDVTVASHFPSLVSFSVAVLWGCMYKGRWGGGGGGQWAWKSVLYFKVMFLSLHVVFSLPSVVIVQLL